MRKFAPIPILSMVVAAVALAQPAAHAVPTTRTQVMSCVPYNTIGPVAEIEVEYVDTNTGIDVNRYRILSSEVTGISAELSVYDPLLSTYDNENDYPVWYDDVWSTSISASATPTAWRDVAVPELPYASMFFTMRSGPLSASCTQGPAGWMIVPVAADEILVSGFLVCTTATAETTVQMDYRIDDADTVTLNRWRLKSTVPLRRAKLDWTPALYGMYGSLIGSPYDTGLLTPDAWSTWNNLLFDGTGRAYSLNAYRGDGLDVCGESLGALPLTGDRAAPGTVGFLGDESALTALVPGDQATADALFGAGNTLWQTYCDGACTGSNIAEQYLLVGASITLDGVYLQGGIQFNPSATGIQVTITNSVVEASYGWQPILTGTSAASSLTVLDTDIRWAPGKQPRGAYIPNGSGAIQGDSSLTVRRADISGSADGIAGANLVELTKSYIHSPWIVDNAQGEGTHNDGVQTFGSTNAIIADNYIDLGWDGVHQNACLFLTGVNTNVTVSNNYFSCGGYSLRFETGTATITGNDFNLLQSPVQFGPAVLCSGGATGCSYSDSGNRQREGSSAAWTALDL